MILLFPILNRCAGPVPNYVMAQGPHTISQRMKSIVFWPLAQPGLFFFLALFPALFWGCVSGPGTASNGAPAWYIDMGRVYPNEKYLAVQGAGTTEREARRSAAGELATLFRAQIRINSQVSFRYSESAGTAAQPSRSIDQNVRLSSNQEISGLEYSAPFRSRGKTYIVAYLDREKVGKIYAERIAARRNQIGQLRLRAQRLNPAAQNTADLLTGFVLYDYSLDLALRNQMLLEQLQITNQPMHERAVRQIDYDSVQLAAQRSEFASRLSFTLIYSGSEEMTFLGESVAQPISRLGFVRRPPNSSGALAIEIGLELRPIQTNNRYENLAWDLNIRFLQRQNADGSGPQSGLIEFAKSGRESGISRSRAITTLKRLLDEQIQQEFSKQVFAYFAKLAGI